MALHSFRMDRAGAASVFKIPNFRRFWVSAAFEGVGDTTARTMFPLIAVSVLGASAFEVGLLNSLGLIAFLLVGLPTGVLVDRWRKRWIMIAASVLRALMLLSLPVAFLVDVLALWQLLLVTALVGVADVFFTTAHSTALPRVVGDDLLSLAAARLHSAQSVIGMATPAVVGVMLRIVSAPAALLVSVASYLLSASSILRTRFPDSTTAPEAPFWQETMAGIHFLVKERHLRALSLSSVLLNAGAMFGNAATVVFALGQLGIDAATYAMLGTLGAAGALCGSFIAVPLLRIWGIGKSKIIVSATTPLILAVYPMAGNLPFFPELWVGITSFGWALAVVLHSVAGADVIPRLAPPHMLGRVTAGYRFFIIGMMPLASVIGGAVASAYGPEIALWGWALLALLSAAPIVCSPVRSWRAVPEELQAPDSPSLHSPESK